jgi:8-oxo-dGTP diphosphatase
LIRKIALPFLFVVAAALFDAQGRVLMAERPLGKNMGGLWEFPGGKLQENETPEAALVRELREELAIDLATEDLAPLSFASHAYPDFHLFMPLYACRCWQGQPKPQEGQKIGWFEPENAARLPLPPADIALMQTLLRNAASSNWQNP